MFLTKNADQIMSETKEQAESPDVAFLETDKPWLTIKEASIFLGITTTTLRTYASEKPDFPNRKKISARKIYYSSELLMKWYQSIGDEK